MPGRYTLALRRALTFSGLDLGEKRGRCTGSDTATDRYTSGTFDRNDSNVVNLEQRQPVSRSASSHDSESKAIVLRRLWKPTASANLLPCICRSASRLEDAEVGTTIGYPETAVV